MDGSEITVVDFPLVVLPGVQEEVMNDHEEEGMDKFGVDEGAQDQEKLEKQAAQGCPECGSKLIKHGSVLLCPNHGSSPFESGG